MRTYIILSVIIMLTLSSLVNASQITIRRRWNLLISWQYSINNKRYQTLDPSGMNLYGEMAGNDRAQKEMLAYRPYRDAGDIFACLGGALTLGTLAAAACGSSHRNSDYWAGFIGSCAFLSTSVFFYAIADRHLRKAVRISNGHGDDDVSLVIVPILSVSDHGLRAVLNWRF